MSGVSEYRGTPLLSACHESKGSWEAMIMHCTGESNASTVGEPEFPQKVVLKLSGRRCPKSRYLAGGMLPHPWPGRDFWWLALCTFGVEFTRTFDARARL